MSKETQISKPSPESTGLIIPSWKEKCDFAKVVTASKLYSTLDTITKALIAIETGIAVGLPMALAPKHVYVVGGVPSFSATFIAGKIKASRPRYNYRSREHTYEKCVLAFFEDGEEVGLSDFSMADAERAGLKYKDSYKKWPRSMTFSRALTQGARWYAPDVLGLGVVAYSPDELGGEVPREDIIDAEFEPVCRKVSDKVLSINLE